MLSRFDAIAGFVKRHKLNYSVILPCPPMLLVAVKNAEEQNIITFIQKMERENIGVFPSLFQWMKSNHEFKMLRKLVPYARHFCLVSEWDFFSENLDLDEDKIANGVLEHPDPLMFMDSLIQVAKRIDSVTDGNSLEFILNLYEPFRNDFHEKVHKAQKDILIFDGNSHFLDAKLLIQILENLDLPLDANLLFLSEMLRFSLDWKDFELSEKLWELGGGLIIDSCDLTELIKTESELYEMESEISLFWGETNDLVSSFLINHDVELGACDSLKKTPLDAAIKEKHNYALELIRQKGGKSYQALALEAEEKIINAQHEIWG